jgi:molecular chaperone DnaJ
MSKRDYYEVLGVTRDTSPEDIKKAYRQCALKYHPDRNPDDPSSEEKFKECTEAYQILSDTEKRGRYDRFGHNAPGGFGGSGDFGSINLEDIFGDLFGDFFGGGNRRSRRYRGVDLRYDLKITFMESYKGTEKEIIVPKNVPCDKCEGSGAKPGTTPATCPVCEGQGQVRYQQGFFSISRTCHRCGGAGKVILDPCGDCRGTGMVEEEKKLNVKIPAGIDTGHRLRLQGEGEMSEKGGVPGDLHVVINMEEHPIFDRHGDDLLIELPISFPQASLGDEVEVPSPEEPVNMKIPSGTQSGKIFRLRGKGMPLLNGRGNGDLHIRTFIEVPTKLSDEQKQVLENFAEISGKDIHPQAKSFWQKVADLFD